MGILSNIEPKEVFHYFEELSMVPRSTFHTKKSVILCGICKSSQSGIYPG